MMGNIFNPARVILLGLLWLSSACSASGQEIDNSGQLRQQTPGYNKKVSIDVQVGRSTEVTLLGMGVELDPHFLSQNVTRGDGAKASDWDEVIAPRIRKMQIERFRVMLQPQWWEPYNDNDDPATTDWSRMTFESAEMLSLYKVLDLAQQTQAAVTLVLWGCPTSCDQIDPQIGYIGRHFLCAPGSNNWVTEPTSKEEFAENFSAVVKHLIQDRGYTCIRELTPFNEPDGNVCPLENYIPLVKVLDARLRADGIRDKVRLNLSDNTDTRLFFLEGCAANLAKEADLFNSHTYIFGYKTPNSTVLNWERANVAAARRAGKEHFVGEFGSNECVNATRQKDIELYERGILMTRHVLNFLNAGAVGVSYWSLIDQYYSHHASYGEMQQLGLWRYVRSVYAQDPNQALYERIKTDYEPRPQYYAYSMLTRIIRKDSEVYPLNLEEEFVAGTAIRDKQGRWSYLFANGSDNNVSINLKNKKSGGMNSCQVFSYNRILPTGDELIAPSFELKSSSNGTFSICIPRQTVLVLSQP